MKRKIIALLLSLSIAVLLLAGCAQNSGSEQTTAQTQSESQASSDAETKAANVENGVRTITDMKGNVVEVPEQINIYVESWFAHNAVDVMLDSAERMAVTCCDPDSYQWMYLVAPAMNDAEYMKFSADMDVESIIALQPDVVFGSNEDYREMFTNVGIPFVNCSFATYDSMIQSIKMTAEILGKEDIAEKYVAYLEEKLDWVDGIVKAGVSDDEKLTIAHGSSIYQLGIDGSNTIIDEWINYSGGINAAAEEIEGNLQTVTLEQLYAWDPDVIITGSDEEEVTSIMSDEDWADLSAVKNGMVYANPKGIFAWDRYGVEEALQFQWCASTLYPDLFPDFDIKAELKDFYREFLNYDLSDTEAEEILNHRDPSGSGASSGSGSSSGSTTGSERTITDLQGNTVTVPAAVEKIASGKLNLTQLTLIVGGEDYVANLGQGADASKGTLMGTMFPTLKDLPVLTEDDLGGETLLGLQPDLVMIYGTAPSTDLSEKLKGLDLNVAICNLGNEEELLQTMKMMAEAIEGTAYQRYAEYEDFYCSIMDDVTEKGSAIKDEDKPKVAYLRSNGAVCGVNSMPNNWITAAGGINIGAEAGFEAYAAELTAEELLNYNPDIIFCESALTMDFLAQDAYQALDAVQQGHCYIVPFGLSCSGLANAENPMVWQWAANIIQPDVYSYDAEQTIRTFFDLFYGYTLSDEELQTVLHNN